MRSHHPLSTWPWKYTRPVELLSLCSNQKARRWAARSHRSFATSPSSSYPNDSGAVSPDPELAAYRSSAPLLRYPPSPTNLHHDLASYASYAARTGLDLTSTVYVGTHFEYVVASSLSRFGFSLRRVGGKSDSGVDLLGVWAVPSRGSSRHTTTSENASASATSSDVTGGRRTARNSNTNDLRVILQCKVSANTTRVGPHLIRELEGAFSGAPPGWRRRDLEDGDGRQAQAQPPVLAILVAQKPATKGMHEALGRSRWPLGFVSCSRDGRIEQVLWNQPAERIGLSGLGVTVQYFPPPQSTLGGRGGGGGDGGVVRRGRPRKMDERLVLTWDGKPYDAQALAAGIPIEEEETSSTREEATKV